MLVKCLKYLGVNSQTLTNTKTKKALATKLVVKIQKLLPDTYRYCKSVHCINIDNKPLLSYASCGQGCNDECVVKELEMGSVEDAWMLINPYRSLAGLHYLCAVCEEKYIPEESCIKKPAIVQPTVIDESDQHEPLHTNSSLPNVHEANNKSSRETRKKRIYGEC